MNYIFGRLHDCTFCGLPKTETISVKEDVIDAVCKNLLERGLYFIRYVNKIIVFTTGLQLDKSFSDGQK